MQKAFSNVFNEATEHNYETNHKIKFSDISNRQLCLAALWTTYTYQLHSTLN